MFEVDDETLKKRLVANVGTPFCFSTQGSERDRRRENFLERNSLECQWDIL
jgi:hypothetical protein